SLPPGNTKAPPRTSERACRRSISTSRPPSPSRSTTTVAAGSTGVVTGPEKIGRGADPVAVASIVLPCARAFCPNVPRGQADRGGASAKGAEARRVGYHTSDAPVGRPALALRAKAPAVAARRRRKCLFFLHEPCPFEARPKSHADERTDRPPRADARRRPTGRRGRRSRARVRPPVRASRYAGAHRGGLPIGPDRLRSIARRSTLETFRPFEIAGSPRGLVPRGAHRRRRSSLLETVSRSPLYGVRHDPSLERFPLAERTGPRPHRPPAEPPGTGGRSADRAAGRCRRRAAPAGSGGRRHDVHARDRARSRRRHATHPDALLPGGRGRVGRFRLGALADRYGPARPARRRGDAVDDADRRRAATAHRRAAVPARGERRLHALTPRPKRPRRRIGRRGD